MLFTQVLLPVLGLFAASSIALPANEPRQITSPSILQSNIFDVDVAVNAHEKACINVDQIFIDAKRNGEFAVITAGKIRNEIAIEIAAFTRVGFAVGGNIADSIHRIGDEEAALIKSASDKIVKLAMTMEARGKQIAEKEDKAILALLRGEGSALMSALRSIHTPLEVFVKTSTEDVEFPGALKRAQADMVIATKTLDAAQHKY